MGRTADLLEDFLQTRCFHVVLTLFECCVICHPIGVPCATTRLASCAWNCAPRAADLPPATAARCWSSQISQRFFFRFCYDSAIWSQPILRFLSISVYLYDFYGILPWFLHFWSLRLAPLRLGFGVQLVSSQQFQSQRLCEASGIAAKSRQSKQSEAGASWKFGQHRGASKS